MRNWLVFLFLIVFIIGTSKNSFGQDNQTDQNKDKVVDLSVGINKVYIPFLTTHMGVNPYENAAWELELRTNYESGFSWVHIFEVYNLNDKNIFPAKPNEDERDEWVVSGRGYAYRYLMYMPSIQVKRLNSYSIFGGGFWLRHEAHRFRSLEKRDGYPMGVNMTAGYGLNILLTKQIALSTDLEMQFNIPKEIQLGRWKVGLHYKFK